MGIDSESEAFVMHFGEMGSHWGFNRTVGQMFALLSIAKDPMNADQLSEALKISRGNVSMGLKELQSWRLIKLHHIPGDRKEYFRVAGSFWALAQIVFEERRKRELDPTLSLLRQILLNAPDDENNTLENSHALEKMAELLELLELLSQFSENLNNLTHENLLTLMKLGSGIGKVLDLKDKVLKKNNE